MRIDFEKVIRGRKKLNDFVDKKRLDSFRKRGISFDYLNLSELETGLIDEIQGKLKEHKIESTRSENYLWIQEPEPFSLKIRLLERKFDDLYMDPALQKEGEDYKVKEAKGYKFYRQIPSVKIFGTANYEKFEDINPSTILEILTNLGYGAKVIPTPQEAIEAIQSGKSSRRSSTKGDDNLVVGAIIGASMF